MGKHGTDAGYGLRLVEVVFELVALHGASFVDGESVEDAGAAAVGQAKTQERVLADVDQSHQGNEQEQAAAEDAEQTPHPVHLTFAE